MVNRGMAIDVAETAVCCPSVLAAPLAANQAADLAKGFAALGDPVRLRVLSMLAAAPEGEVCVCDFIEPLGKSQGTISHHLKILSDAGLVHGDRRGKWVWYSLDRARLAALRATIDGRADP
jgi:ArsR family transcriptional regulator, arsenate/arsenite/antimonite-responsive transcriptional repressor